MTEQIKTWQQRMHEAQLEEDDDELKVSSFNLALSEIKDLRRELEAMRKDAGNAGFTLEKLYFPERIQATRGGYSCCFCKSGSGGVEATAYEILAALIPPAPEVQP